GNDDVAVIDADGVVTGVAAGETEVTVMSGGQNASIDVTVNEGGVIGASETVILSADGAVRISIPAGAAPPGTVITIEPGAVVPPPPGTHGGTGATAYQLGPEGLSFDAPVEVQLSFDAGDLPVWVDAAGLEML